jgi:hypothetical protein
MLKNLNFNLIRFFFIQFGASLPSCAQVIKPPRCKPAAPAVHRLRVFDAQPTDALQLGQALGCGFCNGGQRGIVEDHICRQVVLFGHFAAQHGAQLLLAEHAGDSRLLASVPE